MSATAADLPDDVAILKAMVLAGLEREARMQHIIDQITRTTFGKWSEKLNEDQLALGLDDLAAQGDQFRIRQIRLPAHQNGAGMVRDHRFQELGVAHRRLGTHAVKAHREHQGGEDERGARGGAAVRVGAGAG